MIYTTTSLEETKEIGHQIAATLRGGDVVLLHGDLGAGKTTLTKGIADYFGIDEMNVVSPTFTLMQIYPIQNSKFKIQNLLHVDTYRLEKEEDLVEIGIEEYLGDKDTVCLIEWPEKIEGLLKNKKVINISIDHIGDTQRSIHIS